MVELLMSNDKPSTFSTRLSFSNKKSIRFVILSYLKPERDDQNIILALAFLYSILENDKITSETLDCVNLYPYARQRSNILLVSIFKPVVSYCIKKQPGGGLPVRFGAYTFAYIPPKLRFYSKL
jgi:hypothetical protein